MNIHSPAHWKEGQILLCEPYLYTSSAYREDNSPHSSKTTSSNVETDSWSVATPTFSKTTTIDQ